jgi:hypothetical protein
MDLKKIAQAAGLSLFIPAAFAGVCWSAAMAGKAEARGEISSFFKSLFERPRSIKYVESLQVNTSKTYATSVRESEYRGVQQIRTLIGNSQLEEAWAYLPKKGQWIETGIDESVDEIGSHATIENKSLESILKENDEIILYHFHPMIEGSKDRLYEAIPSGTDLGTMVTTSEKFYKMHPQGTFVHKLCSYYGVTDFQLTKSGIEKYSKTDVVFFLIDHETVNAIKKNIRHSVTAQKPIFIGNKDDLSVNFTPYSK